MIRMYASQQPGQRVGGGGEAPTGLLYKPSDASKYVTQDGKDFRVEET